MRAYLEHLKSIDEKVIKDQGQLSFQVDSQVRMTVARYHLNEALKSAEEFTEFGYAHVRELVRVYAHMPTRSLIVHLKGRKPQLTNAAATPFSGNLLSNVQDLINAIVSRTGQFVVTVKDLSLEKSDERAIEILGGKLEVLTVLDNGHTVLKVTVERPEPEEELDEDAIARELLGE